MVHAPFFSLFNKISTMLYYLFKYLDEIGMPFVGVFQYISFRALAAIIISLIISIIFGGKLIKQLQKLQVGETVRDLGLDGQKAKQGTPTMGGIIIIMAILIPTLLFCKLDNIYVILMITATVWMGVIGFIDDYIKVFKKDKEGLQGRFKILGQIGLGLLVGLVMFLSDEVVVRVDADTARDNGYEIISYHKILKDCKDIDSTLVVNVKTTMTNVPFLKGNENEFDYADILPFFGKNQQLVGWIFFIFAVIFIVTAVSNAANLTDGIDGLAAGTSAIIGATLGILIYVSSHNIFSEYLNILYLPGTEELVVFTACFLGGCIGFLWYNSYPAKVFMGDTGSLMLGGIIAALAILTRKELLIPILCGIFVVENVSVMAQVAYFKYTRKKYGEGRRIFKMAPLHHHYQKLGMHESKIVTRFLIIGVLLAVITIITLKTG
ncbi:MAG: phospho-N-acetylmuramoyl-pentapeptide-transferase [Maribacter sp.]